MSRVEYVAGLFDGESSIGIYRNGRGTYHLKLQLVQNVTRASKPLFEELAAQYGGTLTIRRRGRAVFNWQTNDATAALFLRLLTPNLVLKSEQASVALDWYDNVAQKPTRTSRGQMARFERDRPVDAFAANLLKRLKKDDGVSV